MVKERPASDIGRFLPESDEFSETAENQEDNDSDKPFQHPAASGASGILYKVIREYSFKLTNSNSETI